MKILNRKTRKAIRKSVAKVLKKHGPQIAAGLAGGISSTLATLASTDEAGSRGAKSNLAKLSETVSGYLSGEPGEPRKKSRSSNDAAIRKPSSKRGKGRKKSLRPAAHAEPEI